MTFSTCQLPPAYTLHHLNNCASTNAEALKLAEQSDKANIWLVADRQTEGRGRAGREWKSLDGNLFASLLLRPRCSLKTATQISFVTAVAVAKTIEAALKEEGQSAKVTLKWPNDILLNDSKLGGILIESTGGPKPETFALIVGIGINIVGAPDLPDTNRATSLSAAGCNTDRSHLFQQLSEHMDAEIRLWDAGTNFSTIRDAWLTRAHGIGEKIEARLPGNTKIGIFRGLDPDGALILEREGGSTELISSGEVYFADPAT